jgi:hypothetical protein
MPTRAKHTKMSGGRGAIVSPMGSPNSPGGVRNDRNIDRHAGARDALELELTGSDIREALDLFADIAFAEASLGLARVPEVLEIRINSSLESNASEKRWGEEEQTLFSRGSPSYFS